MSIVAEPFLYQPHVRTRSNRQLRMAAERLLWTYLRDGRVGEARFRRQHLIDDRYLADFVCLEARVVIEVDSDMTPALAVHAAQRRSFLESRGFRILRFDDRHILIETRAVLSAIRSSLARKVS